LNPEKPKKRENRQRLFVARNVALRWKGFRVILEWGRKMFIIARGNVVLQKGTSWLIVSVTFWQDKIIEIEQFSFVVNPDGVSITILPDLKIDITTRLGSFPENQKFKAEKLLKEELALAKQRYASWLFEQIGDKAFVQVREMGWEEISEIIPFSLMYFSLNDEERGKLKQLLLSSCCEELKNFFGNILNLRLSIEKKSI